MDRKDTTRRISKALEKHINPRYDTRIYMSKEVTFDYGSLHPIRVDYMLFKPLNNTISGIKKVNSRFVVEEQKKKSFFASIKNFLDRKKK